MRTCKDIAEIISGSDYLELPFWTRVSVRIHGMMCRCSFCGDYSKQVQMIREIARRWVLRRETMEQDSTIELSPQAKARIKESLH